jgi:hypothetical protein
VHQTVLQNYQNKKRSLFVTELLYIIDTFTYKALLLHFIEIKVPKIKGGKCGMKTFHGTNISDTHDINK